MRNLVLCFALLFTGFAARAQDVPATPAVPTLPGGPLIARAPEYSSWVTVRGDAALLSRKGNPPSPGTAEPKPVKRVRTVKTGPVRYIFTIGTDGKRLEAWCKGDLQIFKGAEWGGKPLVVNARSIRQPLDFSKTDFPECAWISSSCYQGIRKVLDRDCMVFVKAGGDSLSSSMAKPREANPEGTKGKVQACIDLQTRLPFLLVEGNSVTTYEFGPISTTMLTFPGDVQAAIEEKRVAIERLTSRPPRPF